MLKFVNISTSAISFYYRIQAADLPFGKPQYNTES